LIDEHAGQTHGCPAVALALCPVVTMKSPIREIAATATMSPIWTTGASPGIPPLSVGPEMGGKVSDAADAATACPGRDADGPGDSRDGMSAAGIVVGAAFAVGFGVGLCVGFAVGRSVGRGVGRGVALGFGVAALRVANTLMVPVV
jgi:hypothetical protein